MKKIIALLLCISIVALAACTQSPAGESTSASTASTSAQQTFSPDPTGDDAEELPSAVYEGAMAAVSLPPILEITRGEDEKAIAYYTHQDVLITLPDADVAQAITLDLLNRIDQTRSAADKVTAAAASDYSGQSSWYPYSYTIVFQPMRLDQNVLSFFGTETSYDGGPRSVYNVLSSNYDLTTGETLSLRTIFHEKNFADTVCDLIVSGLSAYGSDVLFSDYESIIQGKFSTNVPVDSWYFTDSGLCFYFAPYEIAPFSAGVVVSEIKYEALSGLLKDEYFPSEKLSYSGSILVQAISEGDTALLEQFSQFAEVSMEPGTQQLLIYTDGSVSNLRLTYTPDPDSGVAEMTVLTLAGMGPSDAILVEVSTETAVEDLSVSFESFGQLQTLSLQETDDGKLIFSK